MRPLAAGLLPSLLHLCPSCRTPSTSSEHFLVRWVGSPGRSARCRADRDHARRFYFRNSTGPEDREKSSHTGRVWYLGDVASSDVGSTTRSTSSRGAKQDLSTVGYAHGTRSSSPRFWNRLRTSSSTTLVRESNPRDRSSRVCISAHDRYCITVYRSWIGYSLA